MSDRKAINESSHYALDCAHCSHSRAKHHDHDRQRAVGREGTINTVHVMQSNDSEARVLSQLQKAGDIYKGVREVNNTIEQYTSK